MARAAAEGHRVVLVVATKGELGEVAEGFLDHGETLGERRVAETQASAAVLGVARDEFLGYHDSGMIGEASNDDPACFWRADVNSAAAQLAGILRDEAADVLTIYDSHGNYGHPDHIQVHRVGRVAGELAGVGRILEATMNRDELLRQMIEGAQQLAEAMDDVADLPKPEDFEHFGTPASEVTHGIDVAAFAGVKRASMRCHASQIAEDSFFLKMPEDVFSASFGTEWYIEHGAPRGADEPYRTELFR